MRIAIPTDSDSGAASRVYPHFGSAPCFALVESEDGSFHIVTNDGETHEHGACHPAQDLMSHNVDAVIVGGIGRGALMNLLAVGIRVYHSTAETLDEAIKAIRSGDLAEFQPGNVCQAHAGGCGCRHE